MLDDLNKMGLSEVRKLFLSEMKKLMDAIDVETPGQLRERKHRIKLIDEVLEEKKKSASKAIKKAS